jgi:hypothetical protein
MHQPYRQAPGEGAPGQHPGTGPIPGVLFSDPLSATAVALPAGWPGRRWRR